MEFVTIQGVQLTPITRILNEKGDILHGIKSSEDSFNGFGEAYFSHILYKDIKGWKKHEKMILNLLVPCGKIKFVLYDDRVNSKTFNQFNEFLLSVENYQRLTVSPGIWMAFQGMSVEKNLLLNIANIEHDTKEAIACDINEINYKW